MQPKLLVVSATKGGVGKSSIARNLAVCAAQEGLRVHLLDLDAQMSASRWLSRRPEQAPEIEGSSCSVRDFVQLPHFLEDYEGDLIVCDTPPGVEIYPVDIRNLMLRSSFVLVPCQPSDDDVFAAIEWVDAIVCQAPDCAYVLNRVRPNSRSSSESRQALLDSGYPLAPVELREYEDVRRASAAGIGITELRKAKGSDDMKALWSFTRTQLWGRDHEQ